MKKSLKCRETVFPFEIMHPLLRLKADWNVRKDSSLENEAEKLETNLHWATYIWHWLIDIIFARRNTSSRVNPNYERIASRAGCQSQSMDS